MIVNAGAVVRPDGLRLLGLDPEALAGRISTQPWLAAIASLGAEARAADVLDELEARLTGMLRADRAPDPVVRDAIERLEDDPSQPIAIAEAPAWGIRRSWPGSVARPEAPKRYAELVRFHRVIDAMPVAAAASWSDLAVEAGYYDQSHVIRDFRRFTGFTPADYHRRVSVAGADTVRFVPDPEAAFR